MKLIYPAIIRPLENGRYEARYPDLEGCSAVGDTIDDCLEEANAAALAWIDIELNEFDGTLPPVSDAADLLLAPGEFVRIMSLTYRLTDGWDE